MSDTPKTETVFTSYEEAIRELFPRMWDETKQRVRELDDSNNWDAPVEAYMERLRAR